MKNSEFKPHFTITPAMKSDLKAIKVLSDYLKNTPITFYTIEGLQQAVREHEKDERGLRACNLAIVFSEFGGELLREDWVQDIHEAVTGKKFNNTASLQALVQWVCASNYEAPITAAVAHYYLQKYDKTARLTALLILYRSTGLHGLYSFEGYYAQDPAAYQHALQGSIEEWLSYFLKGLIQALTELKKQFMQLSYKRQPDRHLLRQLESKQQAALALFVKHEIITSGNIAKFFNIKPRSARALCLRWVKEGFLIVARAAKKNRAYKLMTPYEQLVLSGAL